MDKSVKALTGTDDPFKVGGYFITGAVVVYAAKKAYDAYNALKYYPFPGPRGGLLGASIPVVSPESMEKVFAEYTDAQHSPVSFRVKGMMILLLGNVEDIRANFKPRPDQLRRTKLYNVAFDAKPGSPGLFTADGNEWKRQHRAYSPAFNTNNVNQLLPVATEKVQNMMNMFAKLKDVTVLTEYLKFCTTDIICEAALGIKFDYMAQADKLLKGEHDGDERLYLRWLLELRFTDSARALLRNPLLAFIASRFPRWLATRMDSRVKACYERGDKCCAMIEKLIRRKYDEIKEDPSRAKAKCLMDQALLHMFDDKIDCWTEEHMLAVLNSNFATFFLAGSETTAHTTAWLMYYLCLYPDWQARCRQQIQQLLAGRPWSSLTIPDLKQLTLLRACMHECMRVCPTTPMLGNEVKVDDFTIRGRRVPRGTVLLYMDRHCTTVGSGLEDPLAFKPERWLDEKKSVRSESEVGSGVLAFGGGPRVCPGKHLAETEVLLMTAAALATFGKWTLHQKPEEVKRLDMTTVCPGPLGIRFEVGDGAGAAASSQSN